MQIFKNMLMIPLASPSRCLVKLFFSFSSFYFFMTKYLLFSFLFCILFRIFVRN